MSRTASRPRWRHQLGALYRRLGILLESLNTALPTFAGVVYRHRTRCGKPRCVCRKGKLHGIWCVSYLDVGRKRLRTIPANHLRQLQVLAERYRGLRRTRAEMNRTYGQLVSVLDRLEQSLRVPPSRALRWPRQQKGGG